MDGAGSCWLDSLGWLKSGSRAWRPNDGSRLLTTTVGLSSPQAPTRRRQLNIRTYVVVPMSPCAGIMEWVEETKPLGEILIGRGASSAASAHARHRPKDWSYSACRGHMQIVGKDSVNKDGKAKAPTDADRLEHFKVL